MQDPIPTRFHPAAVPGGRDRFTRAARAGWTTLILLTACGGAGSADEGGGGSGQQQGGGVDFEVPLAAEERSGHDQASAPVRFGIPFASGELESALDLEWSLDGGERLPATSRVLSRHKDGSVRWLSVEALGPAIAAGSSVSGVLRPRGGGLSLAGGLDTIPAGASTPLTVRTDHLELRSSSRPGELFELEGLTGGGLDAPAVFVVDTSAGPLTPLPGGELFVEEQTELAVHLVRHDDLADAGGTTAARLTTRVSVWRGHSAVRVSQSLDLQRGRHEITSWRLQLPAATPGTTTELVDPDGSVETVAGPFDRSQVGHDTLRRDGVDEAGRYPGAARVDGTLVASQHFWQLFPSTLARAADTLVFDFCPEVDGRGQPLDPGFGRTQELWIRVGHEADETDPAAEAAALASPLLPHADAAWYCAAEAFGPLGESLPGDHAYLEEKLAQSTDLLLARNELAPQWNYGLQHFGDFFDRENGVAYWGAQNQEYDPAWVLLQQFLRTGDVDYLQPGLETAWHYADVDISWYGGCSQHRATQHRVTTHIARIVAAHFRGEWEAWPQYDGTLDNAFDWLATLYLPGFVTKVQNWMAPEQRRGMSEPAEIELMFEVLGINEVNRFGDTMPASWPTDTLRDFAAFFATVPELQAYGFTDVDADFAGFFALHGGSWAEFPSFHVDDSPISTMRHEGGHSLIQGVALAHCLSGAPRLRETVLSFGRHHAEEVVPESVDSIVLLRDGSSELLYMRTVGWPLVNLMTVIDLTEHMAGEEAVTAAALNAAQDCVDTITGTAIDRYVSSIHAGVVLEGLTLWDRRTAAAAPRAYLHDLARTWAATQYDWDAHAFRYKAYGTTEAFRGMTGLLVLGLAYSESLEHDAVLHDTLLDAWENMPAQSSYAKAFAMLYRGAGRALPLMRALLPPGP